jgi:protein-disulfide isomerase
LVTWFAIACGTPHAETAGNEVELGQTAPSEEASDPPKKAPKWCPKGETGCTAGDTVAPPGSEPGPLDPANQYDVALSPYDPVKGPALAPVTLVVFSDFQCPYCKHLTGTLAELQLNYPDKLRVVWKDLPLAGHQFALPAALMGRQAYAKGGSHLFWQVHDALFMRQDELSDETLQHIAQRFELNWPPLEQSKSQIDATFEQVVKLNIRSTPTTFVNGRPVIGSKSLQDFVDAVERELARHGP